MQVPASDLGRERSFAYGETPKELEEFPAWVNSTSDQGELEAHHQRQRSVKWRTEPDGMTTFSLRLPPLLAGLLITFLTTWVMKNRSTTVSHSEQDASAGASGSVSTGVSTVAQQHVDALEQLLTVGAGAVSTEVIVHVRGDGVTLDDGTPIPDTVAERIASTSFIRVMIHDAQRRPVNVSGRRRHPSVRQKRLVKERDRVCKDCGRGDLLEYDHVPAYQQTGHTTITELELRCAPCHHQRHAA